MNHAEFPDVFLKSVCYVPIASVFYALDSTKSKIIIRDIKIDLIYVNQDFHLFAVLALSISQRMDSSLGRNVP